MDVVMKDKSLLTFMVEHLGFKVEERVFRNCAKTDEGEDTRSPK
jgi:hypothetical protein